MRFIKDKETIKISKNVSLKRIFLKDSKLLFELMQEIYPPAYSHYWKDGGLWYINNQYAKENLERDLSEINQYYYFVLFENEIIGILRLLMNTPLNEFLNKRTAKLHRIYLHQKVQGKGIGKQLLDYSEEIARVKGYEILWLEVMREQPQAFNFYEKLGYKISDNYNYDKELLYKKYQPMYAVYKELN